MVARPYSLGVMLLLSALAGLGLSPLSAAQAAFPGWSAYASPQKSPQFRPWSRTDTRSASVQRQSQMRAVAPRVAGTLNRRSPALSSVRQRQQPVFSTQRAGARKAVPITRGQELGLRFRPDERESPYGQAVMPPGGSKSGVYAEELQSQFRPASPKRKPTYEELQGESNGTHPGMVAPPAMPYPILPPPFPTYPGAWPRW